MIIKNFRNLAFATLVIISLTACTNNKTPANDNVQSQNVSNEAVKDPENEKSTDSNQTESTNNVSGDVITEDGTYIASFDTGGTGDKKYRDYDVKIEDSTFIIEGVLEYIATGADDEDIKTLDDQSNAFAIDQNTQFQVQDTYNQENHSQEEFLKTFEETKGKQIAIFVEVVNGKAVVINLGIKS